MKIKKSHVWIRLFLATLGFYSTILAAVWPGFISMDQSEYFKDFINLGPDARCYINFESYLYSCLLFTSFHNFGSSILISAFVILANSLTAIAFLKLIYEESKSRWFCLIPLVLFIFNIATPLTLLVAERDLLYVTFVFINVYLLFRLYLKPQTKYSWVSNLAPFLRGYLHCTTYKTALLVSNHLPCMVHSPVAIWSQERERDC